MADFFSEEGLASLLGWPDVKAALAEAQLNSAPARPKHTAKAKRPGRAMSWARTKRYRLRQRIGKVVLKVEAEEHPLIEYLIETGRLAEADSLTRPKVEQALQQVVADLVERWHSTRV